MVVVNIQLDPDSSILLNRRKKLNIDSAIIQPSLPLQCTGLQPAQHDTLLLVSKDADAQTWALHCILVASPVLWNRRSAPGLSDTKPNRARNVTTAQQWGLNGSRHIVISFNWSAVIMSAVSHWISCHNIGSAVTMLWSDQLPSDDLASVRNVRFDTMSQPMVSSTPSLALTPLHYLWVCLWKQRYAESET